MLDGIIVIVAKILHEHLQIGSSNVCMTGINIEIGGIGVRFHCWRVARCKGGSVPPGHFLQVPSSSPSSSSSFLQVPSFRRFSLALPASQSSPEYLGCKNPYKPVCVCAALPDTIRKSKCR